MERVDTGHARHVDCYTPERRKVPATTAPEPVAVAVSEQTRRKAGTQSYGTTAVFRHVRRAASVMQTALARSHESQLARPMGRLIRLDSGKWYAEIERDAAREEYLRLTSPTRPRNSMRVRLPFSWRHLDDSGLTALARRPEIRLWTDELGVQWRVSEIGVGTPYPLPLDGRYLVFDCRQNWSGIVRFNAPPELGELTESEMKAYRDRMSDLGGSREGYRPPAGMS